MNQKYARREQKIALDGLQNLGKAEALPARACLGPLKRSRLLGQPAQADLGPSLGPFLVQFGVLFEYGDSLIT